MKNVIDIALYMKIIFLL